MKRFFSAMLVTLLGLMALTGMSETNVVETVTGKIIERMESGALLVETAEEERIQVNVTDETALDVGWALSAGDGIIVTYNGIMTHSLPPQIAAETIQCYAFEGNVLEIDAEGNRILLRSAETGEVWFTLPEGTDLGAFEGQYARVYSNGIMALSYPAQATALKADVIYAAEGEVREATGEYVLIDWKTSGFRGNLTEATKRPERIDVGQSVRIFYNGITTRSFPPQAAAIAVVVVNE